MNATRAAEVTSISERRKPANRKEVVTLDEQIVEIVSDSGEGAQRCGQSLGSIAARMGNGVWTVEIIPAEIQPPARSVAGASGNRIRLGSSTISMTSIGSMLISTACTRASMLRACTWADGSII